MSVFARLAPRLQHAIVDTLGWTSLRPVQDLAGAAVLDGDNVVVLAPTAGGKTEAAMFPVLSSLVDQPVDGVGALYIAPIKALLNNQEDRLGRYTEMVGLRRFVWHGDTPDPAKRAFVREPAELLMTTPESLEVMLISPRVPVPRLFASLRFVVIDEVHAFGGTDRGAHLASVLERLVATVAKPGDIGGCDVQRIGLSATVGNPDALLGWLAGSSKRPGRVVDPPRPQTARELLVLQRDDFADLARDASAMGQGRKSLFFCQSRALAETVADRMRVAGTDVYVHHSSVALEERRRAEERFHAGRDACIVCTSTLELGIDVGDLDRVFQADAPSTVSSFLQRMGRTGRRAGTVPNTTFLCASRETVLQSVALIALARTGWVEPVAVNRRVWFVLVHQLFALALQYGAVRPDDAWAVLSRVPDLGGISRGELDALLAHMEVEGWLWSADGRFSLGERAERTFGRKNFQELYAVFSSPVLYTVRTAAGQELGSLDQDFVDGLVEEASSFLLGGRAWTVELVHHGERFIRVRPAPRGVKPSWGGFAPTLLSERLCRQMREVLLAEDTPAFLHPTALAGLTSLREDLAPTLRAGALQVDDGVIRWWTFAGGRANLTLKHALEDAEGWRVVADNLHLRIEGATGGRFAEARQRLAGTEAWAAAWPRLVARIPNYRLSKFQPVVPEAIQREVLAAAMLDVEGARGAAGA